MRYIPPPQEYEPLESEYAVEAFDRWFRKRLYTAGGLEMREEWLRKERAGTINAPRKS